MDAQVHIILFNLANLASRKSASLTKKHLLNIKASG
jgi:hypothetical protein